MACRLNEMHQGEVRSTDDLRAGELSPFLFNLEMQN